MPENRLTRLSGAFFKAADVADQIQRTGLAREELQRKKEETTHERMMSGVKLASGIIDQAIRTEDSKARKAYVDKMFPLANRWLKTAQVDLELDPAPFYTSAGDDAWGTIKNKITSPDSVDDNEFFSAVGIAFKNDPSKATPFIRELLAPPVATGGGGTLPFGTAGEMVKSSGGGMQIAPGPTGAPTLVGKPEIGEKDMIRLMGELGRAMGKATPDQVAAQAHRLIDAAVRRVGPGRPVVVGGAAGPPPSAPPSMTPEEAQVQEDVSEELAPETPTAPPAPTGDSGLILFKPQGKLSAESEKRLASGLMMDRAFTTVSRRLGSLQKAYPDTFKGAVRSLMKGEATGPFAGRAGNILALFGIESKRRAGTRAATGITGFEQMRAESGVQYSDKQLKMMSRFLPKETDTLAQSTGKIDALRAINAVAVAGALRASKANGADIETARKIAFDLAGRVKGDLGIEPDDILDLIDNRKAVTPEEADLLKALPRELKLKVIQRIQELDAQGL